MTRNVTHPAALHWISGEIARLERLRDDLYTTVTNATSDIEGVDLLLTELRQVRELL